MSLVYRAIWQDDRAELCMRAVDVPTIGTAEARVGTGRAQWSLLQTPPALRSSLPRTGIPSTTSLPE